MNKDVFKFKQGDQVFYSTVFNFDEIYNNSFVSVYSRKNRLGYQRALNERHLKKIVMSLKKDNSPISPTSILLGIDSERVIIENEYEVTSNLKFINCNENNELFRIIDGQHRINSIARYIEELILKEKFEDIQKLKNYEFSVIIMPIENTKRIREVEVFQSINAKAKPLKTDLTKLALIRYQEMERINSIDYVSHITNRIIFSLNDNAPYNEDDTPIYDTKQINVWKNAIIVDVNNDDEIGIIGYSAFSKSIEPICKFYSDRYINTRNIENITYEEFDKELNLISNELTFKLIIPAWNIIREKWQKCFEQKHINLDTEVFYNDNYYLQKNMGLRPLHQIIFEIIKETDDLYNYQEILRLFEFKLVKSPVSNKDWEKAETFKGLSSESGFKLIKDVILGNNNDLLFK
ncbi:DGQHR domain-containing protein [Lysinibacillus capsici]|uniref:DGQHR domain-containing protein n=1 Tax=Lysinibacillus capsici TaxID=2115968 RepID=UPI002E206481|nr:DGQHR domain-containing protein [Lysinibacillus capsici]